MPQCLENHPECHEMTTSHSQNLSKKLLHAFLVLAYLGWGREPEQKAEKEPRMGRPLLIPFSYRLPITQSFISKLTPHLRKKEGRRRQGHPALSLCVVAGVVVGGAGNTECN